MPQPITTVRSDGNNVIATVESNEHSSAWLEIATEMTTEAIQQARDIAVRNATEMFNAISTETPERVENSHPSPAFAVQPEWTEDTGSIRGPGWGFIQCSYCGWESASGTYSTTADAYWEHISEESEQGAAAPEFTERTFTEWTFADPIPNDHGHGH